MIKEHLLENEDRVEMRRIAKIMQKNDFFKIFVNQYQKGITSALETVLEKSRPEKPTKAKPAAKQASAAPTLTKLPSGKPKVKKVDYNQLIMDHISSNNYYRKQLPNVFTGKGQPDQSNFIQEKIKHFTPVPLPLDMKRTMDHDRLLVNHSPNLKSLRHTSKNLEGVQEKTAR